MEEKQGYIYCFKNLLNNKVYIGKTINDPQRRYYQHTAGQINDGTVFHNAMKKYGKENFLFYVIGKFPISQLNEKETFYIKKFNSHWRDGWGYNMSYGGENSPDVQEKPIRAYPLADNNDPIKEKGEYYKSISEACREFKRTKNIDLKNGRVSKICHGLAYSTKGYTFCFVDDSNKDIPTNYKGFRREEVSKHNIQIASATTFVPIIVYNDDKQYYVKNTKTLEKIGHIDPRTVKKRILNNEIQPSGLLKGYHFRYATPEETERQDEFSEWDILPFENILDFWKIIKEQLDKYNIPIMLDDKTFRDNQDIYNDLIEELYKDIQANIELFDKGENK